MKASEWPSPKRYDMVNDNRAYRRIRNVTRDGFGLFDIRVLNVIDNRKISEIC